jgi:hypothetical protein
MVGVLARQPITRRHPWDGSARACRAGCAPAAGPRCHSTPQRASSQPQKKMARRAENEWMCTQHYTTQ